jgi:hypothetical protein
MRTYHHCNYAQALKKVYFVHTRVIHLNINNYIKFSSMAPKPHSGPGPPHYRGFTITLRHNTTLNRTPLDE